MADSNAGRKLDLRGYPIETQVALLASAYDSLSSVVVEMNEKLDPILEEIERKKGANSVWRKLGTIVLAIISGGGAGLFITSANKAAATATAAAAISQGLH